MAAEGCPRTFSLGDLNGMSQEIEVIMSTNCVSNLTKMVMWSAWLSLYACAFLVFITLLVVDYFKGAQWNLQKRTMLFLACSTAGDIVRLALHLAGVDHPAKYLVYPIPLSFQYATAVYLVRDWMRARNLIKKGGNEYLTGYWQHYELGFHLILIGAVLGFLICWLIGPMVYFSSPTVLNWFVIIGYCHDGIFIMIVCFYAIYVGRKLRALITPALNGPDVDELVRMFARKLDLILTAAGLILLGGPPFVLLPIWMGLTVTETDSGLAYFFFFEFTVFYGMRLFGAVTMSLFALRPEAREQTLASRQESNFPTYSLEELNGKTEPPP